MIYKWVLDAGWKLKKRRRMAVFNSGDRETSNKTEREKKNEEQENKAAE